MTVRRLTPKSTPRECGTQKPPEALRPPSRTGPTGSATHVPTEIRSPVYLLNEIRAKRMDPKRLTRGQRQACLLVLAGGKLTQPELADLFGVEARTIRRDLSQIRKEIGAEVGEFDLSEVLGQLALTKDKCQAMAWKQEDPGLVWAIEQGWVRTLRELKVVGQDDTREGFRVTIEALGQGYERATKILAGGLDPMLTGRVIDVSEEPEDLPGPPALPEPLDQPGDPSGAK